MDDVLVIRAERTLTGLRRSLFGMYRWVPTGVMVLVVLALVAILCLFDPGPNLLAGWVPFLVSIGLLVGWMIPRHFKLARTLYAESLDKGPPVFTVTPERIRCDNAGNSVDLLWASTHSLCVSPHTPYVFVNRNCAWFLPRGEHDGHVVRIAREAGVRVRGH